MAEHTAAARSFVDAQLAGATLLDVLETRGRDADALAFWLEELEHDPVRVARGTLLAEMDRAARGLRALGVSAGGRVMLVLPTSPDFVFLFTGALAAAATPVPAYPPLGLNQLASFTDGLRRMAAVADATLAIVPALLRDVLGDADLGRLRLMTPEDVWAAADGAPPVGERPGPDDLALIQFSSGSTGAPKGACISHGNILANVRAFGRRMAVGPDDVCVTWLPLYHDMGLIGTMLGALLTGGDLVLFPPTDFLRRPALWLEILGRYGGTISVAPQFAYSLCVRKVHPERLPGVDLSPLRVLLNGAEPIRAEGVAAFQARFAPLGLRPGVVTPCYGLAEATLAASMQAPLRPLTTRHPLGGAVDPLPDGTMPAIVSTGAPMDGTAVRIVGEDGAALPDGYVGEILLRSDAVCTRLLTDDGLQPATDAQGWLATGDLGFLADGELHITGRLRDLIIIGGRNVYPQDLEDAAGEIDGLRPGRIVACGVTDPKRATEVLVVIAEAPDLDPARAPEVVAALRRTLSRRFGVAPHDTVLVERGQLPLTTSGKLRRNQTRLEYERDGFTAVIYRAHPPRR